MIPLVLLPGMMCDARMWGPQMPSLNRRLVLQAALTESDTVRGLADAVLREAPQRFALAGLSMGGIVAMEIVARAPQRVDRLALLDTNPLVEMEEVRAGREPQIARSLSGGLAAVMREEMKPNYLADSPGKSAILGLCLDMALALGPEVFARQSRALRDRADQTAALSAFKGPALVLTGAEDRLCPRDRHDLMHALMPQSRLAVIAGAGHLPTLEKPTETTAELIRWLEE
jgi:pimeloyl-ACP methyl ester carboxylesterase